MSATDNGGPAFPVSTGCNDGHLGHQTGNTTWQFPGMTLRDYFAAKAMPRLMELELTSIWNQARGLHGKRDLALEVATTAYHMADAMLKAREA